MNDPSRRRMLAVASATLGTLLAGCATGEDGTTTGETQTTVTSATTPGSTTTESTTTTPEQTPTAESTTKTESTSTDSTTTASGTTTGESTTTGDAQATVTVGPGGDLVFEPSSVTVSTGETVTWEWESGGHNVVVDSQPDGGEWPGTDGGSSTTYGQGHTHTFTFEVAGTYEYFCAPHQSVGMRGTVVVE